MEKSFSKYTYSISISSIFIEKVSDGILRNKKKSSGDKNS